MVDIIRLRYVGRHDASVPVLGMAVGMPLELLVGASVDVPGKVVEDDEAADYFVVQLGVLEDGDVRAFARSTWELESGKKSKTKAVEMVDLPEGDKEG
jgi:hypothetical protein